jgi:hypothetical protein
MTTQRKKYNVAFDEYMEVVMQRDNLAVLMFSEWKKLRDQFAMAAMQGMLASGYSMDYAAVDAYKLADLMMQEREK